jgi:hypothetical protein
MCSAAGFWDRLLNRGQLIGLMAQGFQRDLGSAGEVLPLPAPSKQLLVSCSSYHMCTHTISAGSQQLVAHSS